MLEKVKELGLEKFAGDEALADEFVNGFVKQVMEKQAAGPGRMADNDYSHAFTKNMFESVGKSVGGLGVNLGVGAGVVGWRMLTDAARHNRFLKALDHAIAASETLRQQPRAKVEHYADTIYKFAPMVATDPNLLQSVLTNAVHGDGVDITTIKTLTDLEGRWRDTGSVQPKVFV